MKTRKLYFLEFKDSMTGDQAHIGIEVHAQIVRNNKTYSVLSNECRTFKELQNSIEIIKNDLDIIEKKGRKFFNER